MRSRGSGHDVDHPLLAGEELDHRPGADHLRQIGEEIGDGRGDRECDRRAAERHRRPLGRGVEVVLARLVEPRAPQPHQADQRADRDDPRPQEHPRKLAGAGEPETDAARRRQREGAPRRCALLEREGEQGERRRAERHQENVEHRDARLDVEHAVAQGRRRRPQRLARVARQRQRPGEHRRQRRRAEYAAQHPPADRIVAEHRDARGDQQLGERGMLLARHLAGLEQGPRRRHVPGLVEIDLVRRVEAPAEQGQRADEDDDADQRQTDPREDDPAHAARRGGGGGGFVGGCGHGGDSRFGVEAADHARDLAAPQMPLAPRALTPS